MTPGAGPAPVGVGVDSRAAADGDQAIGVPPDDQRGGTRGTSEPDHEV